MKRRQADLSDVPLWQLFGELECGASLGPTRFGGGAGRLAARVLAHRGGSSAPSFGELYT
jgi:hypothetical protein